MTSSRWARPAAPPTARTDDSDPAASLGIAMLDALGEAVVAADPDGRFIYWNDAATRLFGWTADEMLGVRPDEMVAAPATNQAIKRILLGLRHGAAWAGELLLPDRDGRVFPVSVTATPVPDADDGLQAMVAVCRDGSREREAEATARHAEERLELLRRAASSAIWEWEPESGAVRWSESAGESFGYPPAAVEPTWDWWKARVHPEDRARVVDGLHRLIEEGAGFWTDEYRFLTGDRGYVTVFERAFATRTHDGGSVRVVGTLVDVTDRRRLHEGQRFLSQASMILDLSLDYQATLPTLARLAVHALADYCVLHVPSRDGFPPFTTAAHIDPRLQGTIEEAGRLLAGGPPQGSIPARVLEDGEVVRLPEVPADELAMLQADERLRRITRGLAPRSALFVPLRARRSVVGFAMFGRSRDGRRYDEADQRIGEELGRRVGLAVDHARLFQSAELANRAKSDFLAVISHELRTPLTAVSGYADLLAAQVAGDLNETQHRQVDRIRAGADRLLRLIEGILMFARLEAGGERPQIEGVSLSGLLRRAEEIVAPRAAEKGVVFTISLDVVPDTIRTDRDKFVQVLLSLLTNAVKFTARGSVRLRVHQTDGWLNLDVSDSGSGIAPEHLPHVFNPFWQAEQPATRRAGGAGLGLSVAQRLARLLRGDVLVVGTGPGGTTFRFTHPLDGSA